MELPAIVVRCAHVVNVVREVGGGAGDFALFRVSRRVSPNCVMSTRVGCRRYDVTRVVRRCAISLRDVYCEAIRTPPR